jgi:ABC-2 type transport system permease protein
MCTSLPVPAAGISGAPVPARRRSVHLYALEARSELLKVLRMPAYSLPTIAFPAAFYLFFGVAFGKQSLGSVNMATYLLATYGAFGVIGASLFGFGVGVASERGQGWMLLKRATPMPPAAYFAAKTAMALCFGVAIVLLLAALGVGLAGVRLPAATWAGLAAALVPGAIPFCAMGLLIGYLAGPNSAPAVVNLLYLPLSFLSGLWIPVQGLPGVLQELATFLPPYHYAQLALKPLGADQGGATWLHVAVLAGFTALCLAGARWAYLRDEGKTYG